MQYILSEEEYLEQGRALKELRETLNVTIQRLCTRVATHEPVVYHWGSGAPPADARTAPWGCIIEGDNSYCDLCPVERICPHEYKAFSK